jgi:hypothetical protein
MRRRFNAGGYYERMKSGEFTAHTIHTRTPKSGILKAYGTDTRSLVISYRDQNGQEVAEVHQYVDPEGNILYQAEDGTIRRDGLPDPKTLFEDGVLYHLEKKEKKSGSE